MAPSSNIFLTHDAFSNELIIFSETDICYSPSSYGWKEIKKGRGIFPRPLNRNMVIFNQGRGHTPPQKNKNQNSL
jgi:hypothetical protein